MAPTPSRPDGSGRFSLEPPTLTADDLLVLEDEHFDRETVAIVTGAGSGIGRATTLALMANGCTVTGLDIDDDGLNETTERADAFDLDGSHIELTCDLTDDEAVTEAIDTASEHGDIRFLANIAGMQHIASIIDFPMDRFDLMHALMLRAPFFLAQQVMPHIEATDDGRGAIGNMSSIHGHIATTDKPAYIAAKHGLNGLTRSIAAEGDGAIRGFTVSVGYVFTPLMVNQIEATANERGISEQAVVEDVMLGPAKTKRMITPAEVANLFVFGFSSHAEHLNGGDLLFDGGFTTTYD